ncbi:hypothetical protein AAFN60_05085 [Roseibacillus persicicus]|uniref:hypothetical protein n=1 Tax=Roseibacillus persicicus TaxID=454148 RepID=UPI00398B7BC1
MKLFRPIAKGLFVLGIGGVFGWVLRPIIESDPSVPMAESGGAIECGFQAEVTWHPETEVKGENFVMHECTWKWVFRNRSEAPIEFSIPAQKIHLDRSVYSSQFINLPDALRVDPPIVIAPGEEREYIARRRGEGWHKAEDREFGFQVVAKIDETFHILGCAATVREAPRVEME